MAEREMRYLEEHTMDVSLQKPEHKECPPVRNQKGSSARVAKREAYHLATPLNERETSDCSLWLPEGHSRMMKEHTSKVVRI